MPSPYSSKTDKFLQKRFSYGANASIFPSIADRNFVSGGGYSQYGLGISPAQTINPAKRVASYNTLTVSGSYLSHIFITGTGDVYVSGLNNNGKLGYGTAGSYINTWTKLTIPFTNGEKPIQLQTSSYATIILTDQGNVYATGSNAFAQTGLGTTAGDTTQFTKITGLSNIASIWGETEYNTGEYTMFTAIAKDGKVFAWGNNYYSGVLGNTQTYVSTPVNITSFFALATATGAKVKKVKIGAGFLIALMSDGSLWGSAATSQNQGYIGLGNLVSTTNNLRNLTIALNLDLGEKIVDFDSDYLGTAVITDHYLRYTGNKSYYRFGDGLGTVYTWTKVIGPLYDGDLTLTSVDLGYFAMMIGTGSGAIQGGNRIIVQGYNPYGTIGTTNVNTYIETAQFATY